MRWLNNGNALLGCLLALFGFIALYLQQAGWSNLAITTVLLALSGPTVAIWYVIQRREKQQWQQLRSYAIALAEGDSSYQLVSSKLTEPAQRLYLQLNQLHNQRADKPNSQSLLLQALWQHLPYPICFFDAGLNLLFANAAASHSLQRPLLTGSNARQLGFSCVDKDCYHPDLQIGWQQHLIHVELEGQLYLIFYAADLRHPLYQQQKASQQKLVRVLSHELRNSLTPMASMTETLLNTNQLPEQQTRQVLQRIRQRSQRLLGFIDSFVQLQQLPPPNKQWLHLTGLIAELPQAEFVTLSGELYCYADADQLAQLLLNLLKNAVEACHCAHIAPALTLSMLYVGEQQVLTLTDNGPGFANIDNLFTPFYTTKTGGSGSGLLLCQEIIHQHQGNIRPFNTAAGHGCVELRWPLPAKDPAQQRSPVQILPHL